MVIIICTILFAHHNEDVSAGLILNIYEGAREEININNPIKRVVLLNKIKGPNKNNICVNIVGVK